jgi:energy-converting hydrogenase Eha subunit E
MKRIIAFFCVFATLLSATATFAEGAAPLLTIGSVAAKQGESVSVPIQISGNTGIVAVTLSIAYDANLTLTNITAGSAFSSLTMTKPGDFSANPVNLLWEGIDADTTNGVVAILTFDAPDVAGTYSVSASYAPGGIADGNLEDVSVAIQNGDVVVDDPSETNLPAGDLNGSGAIDMQDVLMLYQYFRGVTTLGSDQLAAADVNNSDDVNMQDVLLVYQYFRGTITSFS